MRITKALAEIKKICIERHERLASKQQPGWQDGCVRDSLPALGLLDETSMPYVTGHKRDTILERKDKLIARGKARIEEIKDQVR